MKTHQIPFKKTGFFSPIILDYLEKKESTKDFYNNFPSIEGFQSQIDQKKLTYNENTRNKLVSVLDVQYENIKLHEKVHDNLSKLRLSSSFTVTTGHQLNLFTGPLYFLYKIISTINLCEVLSNQFPEENFIPVYWMATEDHDFEEINHFSFRQKKVKWSSDQKGGVGRFNTSGLDKVFTVLSDHFGMSKNAEELKKIFEEGYLKHQKLAEGTRYIVDKLFGKYGLVILDADDKVLKRELIPYVRKELFDQTSYKSISKTSEILEKQYKTQVNPREINLFYLIEGRRERLIYDNNLFKVNNTDLIFSKAEIIQVLENNPERFSPNVVTRPLYQEVILPNLCYIGGGGELAYWLQLKNYFNEVSVPFPILLLRNSVQIISEKQEKKLSKLNISLEELFLNQNELLKNKVNIESEHNIDFSEQKKYLEDQFKKLKLIASKTDSSFIGAVNAQEKKQLKGLNNLEKRLLIAEKRKQYDLVERIIALQNEILPNQSLEERQRNFSEYYIEYGARFIEVLKKKLNPLDQKFTVIVMD